MRAAAGTVSAGAAADAEMRRGALAVRVTRAFTGIRRLTDAECWAVEEEARVL